MRRLSYAVLVLTACCGATAVHANQAPAPDVTNARASDGAKDESIGTATGEKVICRSDKEVGSRVRSKRVCMTAKAWAQKTAEERQFIEQRQAQRTVAGN